MGDEKNGFLRTSGKQPGEEFAFGGFVERTADLVKQEDVAAV